MLTMSLSLTYPPNFLQIPYPPTHWSVINHLPNPTSHWSLINPPTKPNHSLISYQPTYQTKPLTDQWSTHLQNPTTHWSVITQLPNPTIHPPITHWSLITHLPNPLTHCLLAQVEPGGGAGWRGEHGELVLQQLQHRDPRALHRSRGGGGGGDAEERGRKELSTCAPSNGRCGTSHRLCSWTVKLLSRQPLLIFKNIYFLLYVDSLFFVLLSFCC